MTSSGEGGDGEEVGVVYVDTSLLVSVIAPDEVHHAQARAWLGQQRNELVTSVLAEVELGRALGRRSAPRSVRATAQLLLDGCHLVEVTAEIRMLAAVLQPSALRSLDAIHLATALVAGARRLVSLDKRQTLAAEQAGMQIVAL